MTRLRLAFMGTPEFSVGALDAILAAGHDVVCVYTQPPRPAGRGKKDRKSPVHEFAEAHGIDVRCPKSLKSEEEQAAFAALDLDVAVVVAYGLILPQAILDAPRHGCLNIHASLLPRWRGAAPIQRAIMAGDTLSGVTIMQMEAGLDTGPMLLKGTTAITRSDTGGTLHDRLAEMGARLIVQALDALARGELAPQAQPEEGVTYAHKIDKAESRIDWSRPAHELDTHIRGLSPRPGAFFELGGKRMKVVRAEPTHDDGTPGTVLGTEGGKALVIACGDGALHVSELQPEGKRAMGADEFLRGHAVEPGAQVA